MRALRLSVVVPVLDEAAGIAATLAALALMRADGHEVIVVDGGSRDATVACAAPHADRVVVAARGRASQMNAGAAVATGDVLVFLHADTRLPDDAAAVIRRALAGGARWGRFDVAIHGRSRWLPLVGALMNLRSRLTGIATGDQGMFVERSLFSSVGGFPPIALMEDVALSDLLKRHAGPPACQRSRVRTSGRRWDRDGAWRTIVLMWRLRAAYARGEDPAALARRYDAPPAGRRVLQVFAKAPEPGAVKTRLARTLGDLAATDAYRLLVEHMLGVASEARRRGVVDAVELWCAPDTTHPALAAWARSCGATLHAQAGDDLGERMRGALRDALARGAVPILVGTDCPAIDVGYLAAASQALDAHDAVVGPVEDGGYALIGLARDVDAFAGIAWSTPRVMAQTRRALTRAGARWHELPVLWDVDTAEDLARWRRTSPRSALRAPPPEGARALGGGPAGAVTATDMKPALLWLFPEGWDDIAMRDAASLRGRFDVITEGFDLFRFPENAAILWFDAPRFVDRMVRLAKRRGVVGVVSTHEQYGAIIAALVARRAGLPGPDPRSIALAQHKYYARRRLDEACPGVSPRFGLLPQTWGDTTVREGDVPLPFPCFVKPVKAAYSVLARRVDSADELQRHLTFRPWERHIIRRLVRPFGDLLRDWPEFEVPAEAMLAEELLGGVQVNVDGWFERGEPNLFGVVDSVMHPGTTAFLRFEYPSRLPEDVQARLSAVAIDAMRAVGFDHGAFNVELFWRPSDGAIHVIEINPRFAAQFGDLYEKVDGANPYDVVVALATGQPPAWRRRAGRHGAAASFVFREFDGAVKIAPERAGIEWLKSTHPDAYLQTFIKHGHSRWREMRWLGSYRYAIVNLGGRDRDDLMHRYDEVRRNVSFDRP